ncbi:hypothetical protein [Microbacterium sp. gxy059]|uniref:hypothetical protein n=1 Tax=Microbacterium sp. gxy059 TaxID=2957199 RepID=UPI003D9759F1
MHTDRWEPLFADLEDQFARHREAEHDELAGETERVRVARLALVDRLGALRGAGDIGISTCDGATAHGVVRAVGADWCALRSASGRIDVVPVDAIRGVAVDAAQARASLAPDGLDPLRRRMTFGIALRALARRRVRVRAALRAGTTLTGTIARAGADHLDLALHDADGAPRPREIVGIRILPVAEIARLALDPLDERSLV